MFLFRLFVLSVCLVGLSIRNYAQSVSTSPSRVAPAFTHTAARIQTSPVQIQVADVLAFQAWLHQQLPHVRLQPVQGFGHLVWLSAVTEAERQKLLRCPWVMYIDVPARIPHEELAIPNRDKGVNAISSVQATYPALTGYGMTASIKENPFDSSDIDLKGRVVVAKGSFVKSPTEHATLMTTLVAGGGNTSPAGKGIAWQAHVSSSDFARLLPDSIQSLDKLGVSVQNHSYGVASIENYYGTEAAAYDQQCLDNPWLVHVFSAGNEGHQTPSDGKYAGMAGVATLTGQFKTAKNILTVGAIDSQKQPLVLSSRGPAYDGRIKPELVAYGENGTSEAAAYVSGSVLLVQQAYKNRFGVLPAASLVKALLIASAEDVGRPQVDFETGFGNLNALGAIRALMGGQFIQKSVAAAQSQTGTLQVPAGTQTCKVALVWHDLPALPGNSKALIQDLDLEIRQVSTGKTWKPWVLNPFPQVDSLRLPARRDVDRRNSIELVTLELPEAGAYTWTVRGHTVTGAQAFSLAYVFEQEFEWRTPVAGDVLQSQQSNRIRWQYTGPEVQATLSYKEIGHTQWTPLQTGISLKAGYTDWTPPASLNLAFLQLQLTYGDHTQQTEPFAVSGTLDLHVGYACADKGLIYWNSEPKAAHYQVFRLGDRYMEPLVQTTDTVLEIDARSSNSYHYAVVAVREGRQGLPGATIDYRFQEAGCYIQSFVARKQVTDSIGLDLQLGTVYGLTKITLERKEGDTYRVLQELEGPHSVFSTWTDPHPVPGLNRYRVRLQTQHNEVLYSSVEEVFYVSEQKVSVYPNPLTASESLSVVTETAEEVEVSVYDLRGQRWLRTRANGPRLVLSLEGYTPGLYLLRVQMGSQIRMARILIQ